MAVDRARLEQELENLRAEFERVKARLAEKPDYGLGEGDPAIYEWEMNLTLRQRLERRIETIREILQKMDEGSYGICEDCGEPIDPERLEVLPDTSLCIKCAQSHG